MRPQHLVSVSGGKDSTAVYLLAMEKGVPFRAVFADTGNEHQMTYDYVNQLSEKTGGPKVETVRADFTMQLARHRKYILKKWPGEGIPQDIVDEAAALHEPTGNVYLDMCIWKSRFPSRRAQFCTEELKTNPIISDVVLPMLKLGPVLQWTGIRADESKARAEQPRFNHHESGSMMWRPIFHWKIEQVWAMHRRHKLLPNPLYALGMTRVGCMPCVNCRKDEVRRISTLFPEHIDRIRRWEELVTRVSKRRGASFFAPKNGDVLPIDGVVEWSKTLRGGRKYALFFDEQVGGGCTSDLGLCETSA